MPWMMWPLLGRFTFSPSCCGWGRRLRDHGAAALAPPRRALAGMARLLRCDRAPLRLTGARHDAAGRGERHLHWSSGSISGTASCPPASGGCMRWCWSGCCSRSCLFIIEPLFLARWLHRRAQVAPAATFHLVERFHCWALLLGIVTLGGRRRQPRLSFLRVIGVRCDGVRR